MECRLIAEGVVVTASTDQSTPRFDKSQKLELERVCVCVSVLHTHAHTHTHSSSSRTVLLLLSVVGWHAEGKWEL